MTDRTLPHNVEAEQNVLGSLLLVPASWAKIGDWLTEQDFFIHRHRVVFRVLRELLLAGKPVDPVTVCEMLEAHGLADEAGGVPRILELASITWAAPNLTAYAEIVVEKSRLRQLIAIGNEAANDGFEAKGRDSALLVSEAQRKLTKMGANSQHVGPQPPKPALNLWFQALTARYDADDAMTGVVTPWRSVNALTFGWQAGELIVIAARPNIGKSVLGFNQLAFSGLGGIRCLAFSLEMSYEAVLQRMVSAHGSIPHDWLRSPASDRDADHWGKLTHTVKDLGQAAFLIDDQPRLTAEQIVARATREHMRSPLAFVLVDHLHDMRRPGKDLVNEIADDCRVLKALAKSLKVPVIVLAQLNRQGNDRPVLKDLRGSGGIEEVADLVLLMHRDDYQRGEQTQAAPVELIVGKGRNLPSGKTLYLRNRYDLQRLDDQHESYEPPEQQTTRTRGFGGYDARKAAANG